MSHREVPQTPIQSSMRAAAADFVPGMGSTSPEQIMMPLRQPPVHLQQEGAGSMPAPIPPAHVAPMPPPVQGPLNPPPLQAPLQLPLQSVQNPPQQFPPAPPP